MPSFKDINCEEYSERAIVVRGETSEHKNDLQSLGGKYNARLKGGPGWIYSKKMEPQIRAYIKKGKHLDVVDNSNTDQNIIKRIDALEKKIDLLATLLNRVLTEEEDEEEEIVEEEEIPRKRLLKRN